VKCTKAIIPVAGYGTRRLPITKAIEKSMLPVLNRPVIDYVVEDCIKAGITDIYFVVSGEAQQIRDYYSRSQQLESYLHTAGKDSVIPSVQPPQNVTFHFVEQDTSAGAPYGTAIPVVLCRKFITPDEHVLVLMGDDFIYNPDGSSEAVRLLEQVQGAGGGSALLGVEVDPQAVSGYGVIAAHTQNGQMIYDYIQEKPAVGEAKSNFINVSKYLLEPAFFTYLDAAVQKDMDGAEYYITDPLNDYVADAHTVFVVPAKGTYLDGGTVEGWLHANNFVAQHQG
jgi:UTP--glucose-1-phosphate uridylyltransferase